MRRLAVIVACALTAGCGSMDVERYAVAEGKPAANLRINYVDKTQTPVQVFVMKTVPDSGCRLGISDLSLLTALGGSTNALTDYKPAWTRDVRVAAGDPIVLSLGTSAFVVGGQVSCGFRVQFVPEAGAQYDMTYRSAAEECFLGLTRRSPAGEQVSVPWTDPYPQCTPKDSILKPLQPTPRFPTR